MPYQAILQELKTQEQKLVAIWIAGQEKHRKYFEFETTSRCLSSCLRTSRCICSKEPLPRTAHFYIYTCFHEAGFKKHSPLSYSLLSILQAHQAGVVEPRTPPFASGRPAETTGKGKENKLAVGNQKLGGIADGQNISSHEQLPATFVFIFSSQLI